MALSLYTVCVYVLSDGVVQPVCEAGQTANFLNEILVQVGLIKVHVLPCHPQYFHCSSLSLPHQYRVKTRVLSHYKMM